jgi:hypothetical protein
MVRFACFKVHGKHAGLGVPYSYFVQCRREPPSVDLAAKQEPAVSALACNRLCQKRLPICEICLADEA